MYADNMTGLSRIKSVQEVMKTISEFKIYYDLGVNYDKTELMPLGISNKDACSYYINVMFQVSRHADDHAVRI